MTIKSNFVIRETASVGQTDGVIDIKGNASLSAPIVNPGISGELRFSGGTTQTVTNPPAYPVSNIVPNMSVIDNSTVILDELVSFYCDNLTVQNSTLKLDNAYVEEKTTGSGSVDLGTNAIQDIGGNSGMPNHTTYSMDPSSKVTLSSTTATQSIRGLDNFQTLEVTGNPKNLDGNVTVKKKMILGTNVDCGNNNLTLSDGATITAGSDSFVETSGTGYLIMENVDTGFFPIGPDASNYNGFSFDNNGTTLTSIGARVETGINPTHPNAMYCLQRTWDIIKDGLLNASFTFQWLQTQETQPFEQARTNDRIVGHVCHTPPNWQVISTPSGATGTGIIGDPYKVEIHDIAIVSGFCLGDEDHTLPVQLSSFNAVYSNGEGLEFVRVNWSTSTETDVLGFNIYQSVTDVFDDAVKINTALISGQGTTTTGHLYSYDDLDADVDIRNYYWIEQIDYNGLSEFYGPAVYMPEEGEEPGSDIFDRTIILHQYPNPVENNLKIEYQIKGSIDEQNAVIYIYNMKGEFVETVYGQNGTVQIDLSHYATGVYFYRLQNTSLGETYKFVVVR